MRDSGLALDQDRQPSDLASKAPVDLVKQDFRREHRRRKSEVFERLG